MYTFQDHLGFPITLTFDEEIYKHRTAKHVLIFPFYQGKLMFTIHTKRGIELPGGKVELGETTMAAAVRETYEETGCTLSLIEKIGQYTVGDEIIKDIFFAKVEKNVKQIQEGTVGGFIIFDEIPLQVKDNPRFSPFLYDDLYPLTLAYLQSRGLVDS